MAAVAPAAANTPQTMPPACERVVVNERTTAAIHKGIPAFHDQAPLAHLIAQYTLPFLGSLQPLSPAETTHLAVKYCCPSPVDGFLPFIPHSLFQNRVDEARFVTRCSATTRHLVHVNPDDRRQVCLYALAEPPYEGVSQQYLISRENRVSHAVLVGDDQLVINRQFSGGTKSLTLYRFSRQSASNNVLEFALLGVNERPDKELAYLTYDSTHHRLFGVAAAVQVTSAATWFIFNLPDLRETASFSLPRLSLTTGISSASLVAIDGNRVAFVQPENVDVPQPPSHFHFIFNMIFTEIDFGPVTDRVTICSVHRLRCLAPFPTTRDFRHYPLKPWGRVLLLGNTLIIGDKPDEAFAVQFSDPDPKTPLLAKAHGKR